MKEFTLEAKAEAPKTDFEIKSEKKFKFIPIVTAVDEDGKEVRVRGQEQEFSVQHLNQQLQFIQSQLSQLENQKTNLIAEQTKLNSILSEISKLDK